MDQETKRELMHTGTIGAVGVGTGVLAAKLLQMAPPKVKDSIYAAGAVTGGLGLVGDYGAVKAMKHMDSKMTKQSEENRYLNKIASIQTLKWDKKGGPTDKELAKLNTGSGVVRSLAGNLTGLPMASAAMGVGQSLAMGRSLNGHFREEARGIVTGQAKGIGYAIAGAGLGAAAGAGVGALVGKQRIAKAISNMAGYVGGKVTKQSGKSFLDSVATRAPDQVRKILSDKHLALKGGAVLGGVAVGIPASAYGKVKGDYDGRLASIRNQIDEGNLKNVSRTYK